MEQTPVALRKGSWSTEEDTRLRKCVEKYGEGKWHQVPFRAGLNRCRKSCRLRWLNYLRPDIKRGYFTKDEVDLIIRLHKLLGNRWSLIAGRLPGRTANDVKNFWNTHIYKKLMANIGSSAPTVPKECNHCCKTKIIHKSSDKIIKPRPRNFFKPPAPIQDTTKANKPQTAEESNDKVKKSPTVSSKKPWTIGNVENPKNNDEQWSCTAQDKEDEGIQWWKNLLEETSDNGDVEIQNLIIKKDKSWVQSEGPILSSLVGLGEEKDSSIGALGFGTLCQDHTVVDDVWDWELL